VRRRSIAAKATIAALALGGVAPPAAAALTLRTVHVFDPSSVRLVHSADGARVAVDAPDAPPHAAVSHATWEAGQPELPYQTLTFLVPRGTRLAAVRARAGELTTVSDGVLLAAAGVRTDTNGGEQRPPSARLTAAAQAGAGVAQGARQRGFDAALYPAIACEPAGAGSLHGYALESVRVYPARWDAARRRLVVARRLDIEIDLAPGAALPLAQERDRPAQDAVARRMLADLVVNPDAIAAYDRRAGVRVETESARPGVRVVRPRPGFHPTEAPSLEGSAVEYVIVTDDVLAPAWQALADWKTRRGVPTVVRTTDWILARYRHGSDLQETIRTFVRDAYAKWGTRWLLLGGDSDLLPARYGFSNQGDASNQSIPTDMYFACLDGNWNRDGDARFGEGAVDVVDPGDSTDLFAEVFVGRAPVRTPAEVAALVAKITTYENPTVTSYQQQQVLLSEVLVPSLWIPPQPITLDGATFSEQMLATTGACVVPQRLYENYTAFSGAVPISRSAALAALAAGPGFVNHIGHGFRYNMSCGDASIVNNDALALANSSRPFVLYMLNCTAAAFDFPCLAEAFLKAPGGAVAVLGSTRSAFALQSRNYNLGFYRAVHQQGFEHLGEAFVQSRLLYTPNAWFDTPDHYSHYLYNYLGDPEMVMHTCTLPTTTATFPTAIEIGPTNVAVHVEVDGAPRAGALVCLSKGAGGVEAYEFGYTDVAGNVSLAFRSETAGAVDVTVSGQNMTFYQGTIAVGAGTSPYVHVRSVQLDDAALPPAAGNSDGVLDAGETLAADIVAVNSGTGVATDVGGVLRIAGSWASVQDSVFALGTVGGDSAVALDQVVFGVDPDAPDGTVLELDFTLANGSSEWTDHVRRVVHAPLMRLVLLDVDDAAPGGNGDGVVQAGETYDLVTVFKNYGSGACDGAQAHLASTDPDVTILNADVGVGRVASQQEVAGATRFRVTEATLDDNAMDLVLTDGYGRTSSWTITLRPPAAPATPVFMTTDGAAHSVALSWPASNDADLAGYHVYRAPSPSGPWARVSVDRTLATAYYHDAGLTPNTNYSYRVTAVDAAGNESVPSAAATIRTNPAQLAGWPILVEGSSGCPPAIGDVTGDGAQDVVIGSSNLYAWHSNGVELRDDDGNPQTSGLFATEVRGVTSAPSMAQVDGLPGLEIFCAAWDDSNKAFVLRGDGSILAGWPRNPDPGGGFRGYWGSTAAVDVDGDGIAELFAPGRNGNLYAWRSNGVPLGATPAFKSGFGFNARCSPTFANLDGDLELEIVFGSPTGQLHAWNLDGTNLPGFPIAAGPACLSSTAIGDVDDDGTLDIVMLTEGGFVHVYHSGTATELPGWPRPLPIAGNPISPSPALADFDGDGRLEIVVANNGGSQPSLSRIQVYDSTGNLVPGWPRSVGGVVSESSPIVADFSGDGVSDIVFGNEGGLLYGWDWHGVPLPGLPITIGDFVRATPFATDIDADGDIDLALVAWDKAVYVWDFGVPWSEAAAQWPTLKHDVQRSGQYGYAFDIAPPLLPDVLDSPSHSTSTWSNDPTIDMSWSAAVDASGIGGYSVVWDASPTTLPDQTIDTTLRWITGPRQAHGTFAWFHLRAVDTLGHWTAGALHLGPFRIDTEPPWNGHEIGADRPIATWSSDPTIEVTWQAASDTRPLPTIVTPRREPPETAPIALPEDGPSGSDEGEGGNAGAGEDGSERETASASESGGHDERAREASPPRPTRPASMPLFHEGSRRERPRGPGIQPQETEVSGIAGYSFVWDQEPQTIPNATVETTATTAESPAFEDGVSYWFHVRAVDAAGNAAVASSTLHLGPFWIDTTPMIGKRDRLRIAPVAGRRAETRPDTPPVVRTAIESAVPNPFNPTTTLRWSRLDSGRTRLALFDARGRRVRTLVDEEQAGPGWYTTTWDGRDDRGTALPGGVYFARLEAPSATRSIRLVLVR
jgi:hypothetical protein